MYQVINRTTRAKQVFNYKELQNFFKLNNMRDYAVSCTYHNEKKKTIFANNQSLEDIIIKGITFAIGSAVALLIASAFTIIIFNLIY